jgi:hypothetical protein
MLAYIGAAVEIIRALFALWRTFKDWRRQREIEEASKRGQDRVKAIDDVKNAKTPEEAWDAQERIVGSKPE